MGAWDHTVLMPAPPLIMMMFVGRKVFIHGAFKFQRKQCRQPIVLFGNWWLSQIHNGEHVKWQN